MSDLIMTMLCIAAGSGLRFYQIAALLWWILQQAPRANVAPPVKLSRAQAEQA